MSPTSEFGEVGDAPIPSRPWAESFLKALRIHKSVVKACEQIGKARRTVYDFREESSAFREAWDAAVEGNAADLEAAAFDRATNGWLEPVYFRGEAKGIRRRFSDRLTMFMLRCHRPAVYNITLGDQAPADPEALTRQVAEDRAKRKAEARRHRDRRFEQGSSDVNTVPTPDA